MEEHVYPVEAEAMQAIDDEVRPGVAYPARSCRDAGQGARAGPLEPLPARRGATAPGSATGSTGSSASRWAAARWSRRWPSTAPRPTPGNMEILADHGTDEQKERFLRPLLDGEIRSCFSMTEPEVAGSDPTTLQTTCRAGRRRVGDQRPQVVHLGRQRRRVRDRDGRHRPRRAALHAGEHDPGPGRHPGLRAGPQRLGDGPRRGARPLRDPLHGLPRAGLQPARRARRRLRDRPGPPRAGPHPPLHARDRHRRAGHRDDVRARQHAATPSAARWPTSSSSRTSSPSRAWRSTRPAC